MGHSRFGADEVERRGKEWYQQYIRAQVETPENIGKIISIDIETGDYEIDADLLAVGDRLLARHPDAEVWGERIGYDVAFAIGGTRTRTAP